MLQFYFATSSYALVHTAGLSAREVPAKTARIRQRDAVFTTAMLQTRPVAGLQPYVLVRARGTHAASASGSRRRRLKAKRADIGDFEQVRRAAAASRRRPGGEGASPRSGRC